MTRATSRMYQPNNGRQTWDNWKIVTAIAVTWTVILACIALSAYKAEECSADWHNFQRRMTSALVELDVLKQQTVELKTTLQELSKLQLLDASVGYGKDKTRLFQKLIFMMQSSDGKEKNHGTS